MNQANPTFLSDLSRIFRQGQSLNERRERLGMSVAALSTRSGVSPATIHRILHGDCRRATLENIARVADALGVRIFFEPRLDPEAFKHDQAVRRAREIQGLNEESDPDPRVVTELLRGTGRRVWAETGQPANA